MGAVFKELCILSGRLIPNPLQNLGENEQEQLPLMEGMIEL
jgi:hypothetical protein